MRSARWRARRCATSSASSSTTLRPTIRPRSCRRTLDELGDPRFRTIRLDKNVGQTGATRRGLAATKGTFVCFLDSDDLWNPDFLERHLAAHLNEVLRRWASPPATRG